MYYDLKESGKRIAELRKEKAVTQEQMALELGVNTDTIGRIERGLRGTSVDMLLFMADYFGTTVDFILTGKRNGTYNDLLAGLDEYKRDKVLAIMKTVIENI